MRPVNVVLSMKVGDLIDIEPEGSPRHATVEVLAIRGATVFLNVREAEAIVRPQMQTLGKAEKARRRRLEREHAGHE